MNDGGREITTVSTNLRLEGRPSTFEPEEIGRTSYR
jgi:hypothetical protein